MPAQSLNFLPSHYPKHCTVCGQSTSSPLQRLQLRQQPVLVPLCKPSFDASKSVQWKTGLFRSNLGAQWSLHDEGMGRYCSAKAHVDSKMQLVIFGALTL